MAALKPLGFRGRDTPHPGLEQGVPVLGMVVYGEQKYQESFSAFLTHLRVRTTRTQSKDLDQLRLLLIQVGQFEQAVEDCPATANDQELCREVRRLSDLIATAFVSTWWEQVKSGLGTVSQATSCLCEFGDRLQQLNLSHDTLLEVKIPEGFEYYSLFPEQYGLAAMQWAAERSSASVKCALVLGLRSIGTTLSAVVAACLKLAGWRIERATVRPGGHAFARTVEIPNLNFPGREFAIVVDEGPGLSGSSMAGASRALAEAGYQNLALMPGHGGEPGTAASTEVRRWWKKLPRYWMALEKLRWHGFSLPELLARKAQSLVSITAPLACGINSARHSGNVEILDATAGTWRRMLYAHEAHWPAVATRFERTKYLCRFSDGSGILWKFVGLGCCWSGGKISAELELESMTARRNKGFVMAPLETFHGFVALPWIEGKPLPHKARSEQVLKHIGAYVAASAGPKMSPAESVAGIARLEEMLRCNAKEAFGDRLANEAARLRESAAALRQTPSYTDGRMMPHEWIQTAKGQLLKADYFGHVYDHTLIGKQSLLWDVAGALVEWGLRVPEANVALRAFMAAGESVDLNALNFYQAAYAAFRMGVFRLCAEQAGGEPVERERLVGAASFYQAKLGQLLKLTPAKDRTSDSSAALVHPMG